MKWLVKAKSLVSDGYWTDNVEAPDYEEAVIKGSHLAVKSGIADLATVEVDLIGEDKQAICDKLVELLQLTRNLNDVIALEYVPDLGAVVAQFASGRRKTANVAMDSGTSMIRDIIKQII